MKVAVRWDERLHITLTTEEADALACALLDTRDEGLANLRRDLENNLNGLEQRIARRQQQQRGR